MIKGFPWSHFLDMSSHFSWSCTNHDQKTRTKNIPKKNQTKNVDLFSTRDIQRKFLKIVKMNLPNKISTCFEDKKHINQTFQIFPAKWCMYEKKKIIITLTNELKLKKTHKKKALKLNITWFLMNLLERQIFRGQILENHHYVASQKRKRTNTLILMFDTLKKINSSKSIVLPIIIIT